MTDTAPHPAIGRTEVAHDRIDLRQARHMQLTLDAAPSFAEGDALPPFWHYLYFNPQIRASDLAADGHERLGRFLPDLGLPRRMWAGGRLDWHRPLVLGTQATKTTTIRDISRKTGRSGALGFVTVTHDFVDEAGSCFTETQNIVYREAPSPDAPPPLPRPAPQGAEFQRRIDPDPILLFRYSALIFYGHRIHYDADYTRGVEGYPGLVVHGPLTATLLIGYGMEQAQERPLAAIEIRAISPLFAPDPFWLEGAWQDGGLTMWARTESGALSMLVTLRFTD
ncbi:FAS1-like dehydratase domain-containing protein [Tropicimonas sp. S265A]|uniref:FAS1-like dehydratase domain-containing protein n=1 Tax=Tropicimonas sp. S265A TaxID=3415134 RepID=UPI003C7A39C5